MQWFLALNEGCPAFEQYAQMARVAIHTALRCTSLRPHFLYDGGENEFTRWLRHREVPIIRCRTSLFTDLVDLGRRKNDPNLVTALPGIFLRTELPRLRDSLDLNDRVLYTDCDVFFRRDPVAQISSVACEYFAVAPEFALGDYENMNTGVMWMNLPELSRKDEEFKRFVRQNIDELQSAAWDQGAYRRFFRTKEGVALWDKLPPELNWKPYWGDSAAAAIIHFHGPKPFQRNHIDSHFPELKELTGGCYEALCDLWKQLLVEAK
jgi:hypothetical protein